MAQTTNRTTMAAYLDALAKAWTTAYDDLGDAVYWRPHNAEDDARRYGGGVTTCQYCGRTTTPGGACACGAITRGA